MPKAGSNKSEWPTNMAAMAGERKPTLVLRHALITALRSDYDLLHALIFGKIKNLVSSEGRITNFFPRNGLNLFREID